MRTPRGQARLRRTYAVLACLLWLLGVEVLPDIHLAMHAGAKAHTHTASGMVVTVSFDRESAPHRHADGSVHEHAPKTRKHRPGELAIDRTPDAHVAAGLAHHALALHAAAPPILDAVAVDRVVTEHLSFETGRDAVAVIATCDARGPPAV